MTYATSKSYVKRSFRAASFTGLADRRTYPAMGYQSNFIKEWRERRGLHQWELAEKAGTTEATISRIETGDIKYTQNKLESIAVALDLQPFQLLLSPAEADRIARILQMAKEMVSEPTSFSHIL